MDEIKERRYAVIKRLSADGKKLQAQHPLGWGGGEEEEEEEEEENIAGSLKLLSWKQYNLMCRW